MGAKPSGRDQGRDSSRGTLEESKSWNEDVDRGQPSAAPSGNASRYQSSFRVRCKQKPNHSHRSPWKRVKRFAEPEVQRDVDTRARSCTDPMPSSPRTTL